MVKKAKLKKRRPRPLKIVSDPNLSVADQARKIHGRVERRLSRSNLPPISCKPGCSHCCYKLTVIGVPDGLMLAEAIILKPNWRTTYLPKLRAAALKACEGIVEQDEWFNQHIACPVLDVETGMCSTYEARPTACRYHLAVTPAELCDPKLHPGASTAMVDLLDIENAIDEWQFEVSQGIFGEIAIAPLPIMVIYCIGLMEKGDSHVKDAIEGITDPRRWVHDHQDLGPGLQREVARRVGIEPDAKHQLPSGDAPRSQDH